MQWMHEVCVLQAGERHGIGDTEDRKKNELVMVAVSYSVVRSGIESG